MTIFYNISWFTLFKNWYMIYIICLFFSINNQLHVLRQYLQFTWYCLRIFITCLYKQKNPKIYSRIIHIKKKWDTHKRIIQSNFSMKVQPKNDEVTKEDFWTIKKLRHRKVLPSVIFRGKMRIVLVMRGRNL